jgi:hypothetical protein
MSLPVSLRLRLELPDIVIGIVIPVLIALLVNWFLPVCENKLSAVLFAVPVFIVHFYFFSVSDWFLPGLAALANPGDIPSAGQQEITNGLLSILVSLLLLALVAAAGWTATRIGKKTQGEPA